MVDQKLEYGEQRKRKSRGGRRYRKKSEIPDNLESVESKMSDLKLKSPKPTPQYNGYNQRSKTEQSRRINRTDSVSSGYSSASTRSSRGRRSSNFELAAKTKQMFRWNDGPKGLDNPNNYNKVERPVGNESTSEDEEWEEKPEMPSSDKSRYYLSCRELAKRERERLMPKIEKIEEDRFEIGDDQWAPRPMFVRDEIFETEAELQMYEDQLKVALHTHNFRDYYPSSTVPLEDSAPSPSTSSSATELLDAYTHHNACQFQAMCTVWKLRPILQDPYTPEDLSHAIPTVSTVPAEITVAWYQVIAVEETSYLARACHVNLMGSLSNVVILRSSRVKDYGSSILGGLVMGDLLVVHELRRTGRGNEDRDVPISNQCYWQIARFQVFRREIQKFEYSIFLGDEEHPQKFLMDIESGRFFENNFEIMEDPKNFKSQESKKLLSVEIVTPMETRSPKMCTGANLDWRELQKVDNRISPAPPTFKPTLRILKETKIPEAKNLKFWSKIFETTLMAANCALRASKSFKISSLRTSENSELLEILIPWNSENWIPGSQIDLSNGQIAKIKAIAHLETEQSKGIQITVEAPPTSWSFSPKYVVNMDRILEPGFFKNLEEGSNGKRIIEAMYGGEEIEAPPTSKDLYVSHGCPMTISFCKDSIISAAIDIAQHTEQCQILLITAEQSKDFEEKRVFEEHGIRTATLLEDSLLEEELSNAKILICTMDTIGALIQYPVRTIQILNGFEILETDFIWLTSKFPNANFGIFAGNSNLPPISRKFAIGNFVERAIDQNCCPRF